MRSVYSVKEMFYTLQGEGAQAGRPAVFCRFTGCNLWSGREQDRAKAICDFCDTDFVGTDGQNGDKFRSPEALAKRVRSFWPLNNEGTPYVVCTGGEPLLQLDEALIAAFKAEGLEIALETNGTLPVPDGVDWICVSPKGVSEIVQTTGHELKLVYPQSQALPERFADLRFDNYYLQPLDDALQTANTKAAVEYCMAHPKWKLSLQTHKFIGID
ncbi:7-carboxy-7-deazaguanine synthase [Aliamphritea ceti]|uniref:7-carboxy-7-deazaguanine synthase n=1 Tax=Aliamphritea ceti TaxID=1524258 RepID=UPI0021C46BF9|nr:7-carboxy-7-deazaguanine synthase [Aliamphritea ceti]